MESRWFLFPGQTLENTKISDRAHALHITSKEWGNITKHLDRKKLIQEAIEKEDRQKKYLEEGSKSMIKNWENSLENIRKRKEEERLKLLQQKKADRNQRFFELRKDQEEIRKKYVDKVKKQIFMTTGNARELTYAFVTSEILFEREKQKEFKEIVKKHNDEQEAKYAEIVKVNAEKELTEKKEKEQKLLEKKKQHGEYLKKVIEEAASKEKEEKAKHIQKEALDNIRAVEEMECMKKKQEEEKIKRKKHLFAEKQKMLSINNERSKQLQKEEKELDDVVAIFQDAKHRIDCMKKQKEKELQDAQIARRDAVVKVVMAENKSRLEEEEKMLQAAIAERESIEEAKVKARFEIDAKNRQERIEDRNKCVQREEAIKKKEEELRKWEMLNRYKTNDMRTYDERKRKEHWEQILKYRKELIDQMEEDKMARIQEKEMKYITDETFVNEDDKFFEYADEVIELAKKNGRSTYPIEKVIKQYKKTNNLLSMEELRHCEKHRTYQREDSSKIILKNPLKPKVCKCYKK